MSDLISRQDAIDAVCEECEWERKCHEECQHIETLKSIPSASKTREWINHYDDGYVLAWMPLPEPYKGGDDE